MNEELKTIADHYGLDGQLNQTMEECAELIQACNKYKRNGNLNDLIEEIADVSIMIEQLKYLLNIKNSTVENCKTTKINRQIERIRKETKCQKSI